MVIPLGLQRRVEGLLQEHLDRVQLNSGKFTDNRGDSEHLDQRENAIPDENADSLLDGSVMEKVLQRRSLRMRNMQRAWQVSFTCLLYPNKLAVTCCSFVYVRNSPFDLEQK